MASTNSTTGTTLSEAHMAVLKACGHSNLRVTSKTDLVAMTVHHSTARSMVKTGLVRIESTTSQPHIANHVLDPQAQPVAPKQQDHHYWLVITADGMAVLNPSPSSTSTSTTSTSAKPTTTTTSNTSTHTRESTTYPRCLGCNAQCNPSFLNGGYCKKAGCEVKRRQTLLPGKASKPAAPAAPVADPAKPAYAEVKAVNPVKVPISEVEVRPAVQAFCNAPSAAPVAAPKVAKPVPVVTGSASAPAAGTATLTVAQLKAHVAACHGNQSRNERVQAGYTLLKAAVLVLKTVELRDGDNVQGVLNAVGELLDWATVPTATPVAPAPVATPAPVAQPTPAPVAAPMAQPVVDHRPTVQQAISEGTLGALVKACALIGLVGVDTRDGGKMRSALREWLGKVGVGTVAPVAVQPVAVETVTTQTPAPAPTPKPVKPAVVTPSRRDQSPEEHAHEKRQAKSVELSLVQYRVLKALGCGRELTYRDVEAITGYYSILTENMRVGKHNSLGSKGLLTEQEGSIDNPGKITFKITAKGREYLAKAKMVS